MFTTKYIKRIELQKSEINICVFLKSFETLMCVKVSDVFYE